LTNGVLDLLFKVFGKQERLGDLTHGPAAVHAFLLQKTVRAGCVQLAFFHEQGLGPAGSLCGLEVFGDGRGGRLKPGVSMAMADWLAISESSLTSSSL